METQQLKQFMIQISAEAGEYLRNHFYTFKNVIEHDRGGVVTNVELALTNILVKRISSVYPDHTIVVAGTTPAVAPSGFTWLIDPLDGSSHFSRNIPIYTVNIALIYDGEILMGTVNQPQTHQLFFAERGHGAYLNGIAARVSDQNTLAKAFVFVELPEEKFSDQLAGRETFEARMALFREIVRQAGQTEALRIGAFGQCLVAAGAFDAYIDLSGTSESLSQAASQLIVREAGGEITAIKPAQNGFIQLLATNGRLTDALQAIINQ